MVPGGLGIAPLAGVIGGWASAVDGAGGTGTVEGLGGGVGLEVGTAGGIESVPAGGGGDWPPCIAGASLPGILSVAGWAPIRAQVARQTVTTPAQAIRYFLVIPFFLLVLARWRLAPTTGNRPRTVAERPNQIQSARHYTDSRCRVKAGQTVFLGQFKGGLAPGR
jgi:hypothetical protein